MDQLMIARRLMRYAQRAEDRRNGKPVDAKSLKEDMEEDSVQLGGYTPAEPVGIQKTQQKTEDMQIKLSDLFTRLRALDSQQAAIKTQQVQVNVKQVVEREASLRYTTLEKVEGLVRKSQTQAETDRYRFEFSNGTTFKITDKWSNRSTTIWGDPHVDVDDVDGDMDGDFKDMIASDSHTTLMLQDGTRVTFTALDSGLIEAVDIFKGNQHLDGIGEGSTQWKQENGLFASQVDNAAGISSSVPMGDTVYAGGDGNDWYTAEGKLLWGKTTGPEVSSRPYSVLQMEYKETISQEVSVQVNKQA